MTNEYWIDGIGHPEAISIYVMRDPSKQYRWRINGQATIKGVAYASSYYFDKDIENPTEEEIDKLRNVISSDFERIVLDWDDLKS
jgi:hypothetical protein